LVSSPRAAAPSKPAKERNPNTAALATAESEVPLGILNASRVTVWPWGAEPPASLATMMIMRIKIRVTEMPSMVSRNRVAMRMSPKASTAMRTAATAAMTK
jgi:hypothetical protein